MKIRKSFISNSSSSSFVVFGKDLEFNIDTLPEGTIKQGTRFSFPNLYLKIPTKGQKRFGWEFKRYNDILSKINFAYIQTRYIINNFNKQWEYTEMLKKVIKKHLDPNYYFTFKVDYNYFFDDSLYENSYCDIDHASSALEGRNLEIFESEEVLENFIFNKTSYIQCGNDNSDPTSEWLESSRNPNSVYFKKYLVK